MEVNPKDLQKPVTSRWFSFKTCIYKSKEKQTIVLFGDCLALSIKLLINIDLVALP